MSKKISVDNAVHVLIGLFTLTSFANLRAFLVGAGHDPTAAIVLSATLGTALAVIALALSKVDARTELRTFWALLIVGLGLSLLSGAMQSAEYNRHLGIAWSIGLGFGIPLLGEVGLSIAAAMFRRSQHREDLRNVNARIEAAVIDNLDLAISNFDPATIQKRLDRALNMVAVRAVDNVAGNLLSLYDGGDSMQLPQIADNSHNVTPVTEKAGVTTSELSEIRRQKADNRVAQTAELIEAGAHTLADIAARLGKTERTIQRYIKELREDHGRDVVTDGGIVKFVGAATNA